MKQRLLLSALALVFLFAVPARAQLNAKMEIATVHQKDNVVQFTITSDKPFRMGGNAYVLHIGEEIFFHYRQYKTKSKGRIVFYIPSADFDRLTEGNAIYLTYGQMSATEDDELKELYDHHKAWSFGSFSSSLLQ